MHGRTAGNDADLVWLPPAVGAAGHWRRPGPVQPGSGGAGPPRHRHGGQPPQVGIRVDVMGLILLDLAQLCSQLLQQWCRAGTDAANGCDSSTLPSFLLSYS